MEESLVFNNFLQILLMVRRFVSASAAAIALGGTQRGSHAWLERLA